MDENQFENVVCKIAAALAFNRVHIKPLQKLGLIW